MDNISRLFIVKLALYAYILYAEYANKEENQCNNFS